MADRSEKDRDLNQKEGDEKSKPSRIGFWGNDETDPGDDDEDGGGQETDHLVTGSTRETDPQTSCRVGVHIAVLSEITRTLGSDYFYITFFGYLIFPRHVVIQR